jgi:hypothetical protein
MFPTSYHGYNTHSEFPLLPLKVGCATRGTMSMRDTSRSNSARGFDKVVSVSLQRRPHTMYGREYTMKTSDLSGTNKSLTGTVTNHIHQNYRRNLAETLDKPEALETTFKSVQTQFHDRYATHES